MQQAHTARRLTRHVDRVALCVRISKEVMDPDTDPDKFRSTAFMSLYDAYYSSYVFWTREPPLHDKYEELVAKPVMSTKLAWRRMALEVGPVVALALFEDRASLMASIAMYVARHAHIDIKARLLAMYSTDFVDRPLRIWSRYVIMSDDLGSCGDASAMIDLPAEVRSKILEAVLMD
jgi:hypothetical protein